MSPMDQGEIFLSEGFKQISMEKTSSPNSNLIQSPQNQRASSKLRNTRLEGQDHLYTSSNPQRISPTRQFLRYFSATNTTLEKIRISEEEYFNVGSHHKLLHFFQDNSQNLFMAKLNQIDLKLEKFELKIKSKIPVFHRSIITPLGDIYITGGLDPNTKRRATSQVSKFNYRTSYLDPCQNMNYPRHSHSICWADGSIYVVGGAVSDQDEYLNKCEKFDVETSRWTIIADCKYGSVGSVLANFRDLFIFKFGGKPDSLSAWNSQIETYSIQRDEWQIVKISQENFNLPSFGAALQINET